MVMDANRHSPHDLAQMQSIPLEGKIIMTQERIRQWYEHWDGQVYVSFSGGKDSTVLKHIVDGMYDDVPSVFVNTGLEYPEIQQFARQQKNVVIVRPEMRFDEVIKKYGYPVISKEVAQSLHEVRKSAELHRISPRDTTPYFRKFNPESDYCKKNPSYCLKRWDFVVDADFNASHMCCSIMKKKPAKKYEKETGRKPFVGTLAMESRMRKARWEQVGCNAFEATRPISTPMAFWTEQDVLRYLKINNVPYCSVYGEIQVKQTADTEPGQMNVIDLLGCYEPEDVLETTGRGRTGCIFCMFGCHLEKGENRFQRLKRTHPRQYEYCINGGELVDGKWQPNKEGLGLGHVLDYIGVKYD